MLNGPFGVGKTTAAQALCAAIPDAMLYDPEIVGTALRSFTAGILPPEEQTDDFQDIALWPTLTVQIAEQLMRQYRRHLIVPMTIAHPGYFATITSGLRALTDHFAHVCLLAPLDTIQARLRQRGDDGGSWGWQRTITYLPRLAEPRFAQHVQTEDRSPQQVADDVLRVIGLTRG
ncbi:AAA family ATPase [Oscillochloris sp. ZM17-4]|uniref:AAA family ATPase n=1 Tax=Oscillochloris sp. ZM17-4 TaxID=2866714 RepID=UPI002107A728|nr:AAA family ATPase [Oscillochloris sp. ZM17-4]